jgi:pyruvate kinase
MLSLLWPRFALEAEKMLDYRRIYNDLRLFTPGPLSTAESVASAAVSTVLDLNIDLIIVLTDTGKIQDA